MNTKEFLAAIDPDAGWRYVNNGKEYVNNIRDGQDMCPVCHVTARKGLGHFMNADYDLAAYALRCKFGLFNNDHVQALVEAADNERYHRAYSKEALKVVGLRKKLIKATGLKEDF